MKDDENAIGFALVVAGMIGGLIIGETFGASGFMLAKCMGIGVWATTTLRVVIDYVKVR
jgi:hypothetical protein